MLRVETYDLSVEVITHNNKPWGEAQPKIKFFTAYPVVENQGV